MYLITETLSTSIYCGVECAQNYSNNVLVSSRDRVAQILYCAVADACESAHDFGCTAPAERNFVNARGKFRHIRRSRQIMTRAGKCGPAANHCRKAKHPLNGRRRCNEPGDLLPSGGGHPGSPAASNATAKHRGANPVSEPPRARVPPAAQFGRNPVRSPAHDLTGPSPIHRPAPSSRHPSDQFYEHDVLPGSTP